MNVSLFVVLMEADLRHAAPSADGCCASSSGSEQCATLLRLLVAALTPLTRQTDAWIESGLLHDPTAEFFIVRGKRHHASLPHLLMLCQHPKHLRRGCAAVCRYAAVVCVGRICP